LIRGEPEVYVSPESDVKLVARGWAEDKSIVSQVMLPLAFFKYFVPEVEVTADRTLEEFAAKTEPAGILPSPVPPLSTVNAEVDRVRELKLPAPVVVKLPEPEKLLVPKE